MKSKLKIIMTILVCFLCGITTVSADLNDNTTSDTSDPPKGCSGKDSCWNTDWYGLRVSLYTFERQPETNIEKTPTEKIGVTVDFIANDNGGSRSVGQLTRIEILNGKTPTFTKDKGNVASAGWLSNMFENSGQLPIDVKKHVMGACYGKQKTDYANDVEYIRAMQKCLEPFFNEMGASANLATIFENILTGTNTKDIFIIYEPIASIQIGKPFYMITGTETAWFYNNPNYSTSWIYRTVGHKWVDGVLTGHFISKAAYQSSKKIAGFTPINLRTTFLRAADYNNNRYGIAVGVATLSEFIDVEIEKLICVEKDGKYYGSEGKDVTKAQYEQQCFPQEPELCTFDLVSKIVKDCKTGTEGYVKDIDDWECIYASRDSSNANVKDHFYTDVENRYCSIFCREEIYYYYPNSSLTVRAGNHFAVGKTGASNTLLPVNMTGRSECRVTSGTAGGKEGIINYEQFAKDWESANKTVLTKWNEMNIQIAYSDSIKNATKSSSKNCAKFCDTNDRKECCLDYDSCAYTVTKCSGEGENRTCREVCRGACTGGYDTPYYHGYWYSPTTEYYNGKAYKASGWCTHCGNSYRPETCSSSTSLSSAVTAYNNAVRTRNNYLTQLMECNNFQRTYREFEPEVQFKYNEGEYESLNYNYSYSDILDKDLIIRAQTNYYTGVPEAGSVNHIRKWNTGSYKNATTDFIYDTLSNDMIKNATTLSNYYASGGSRKNNTVTPYDDTSINNSSKIYGKSKTIQGYDCGSGYRATCNSRVYNITYPVNDSVRMWTTKEYDYKLYAGVYNYVRKDTGQSLNYNPDKNYYVVGYSNLPTHYSRKSRDDYNFYLDFSPVIFGENQKFYKYLKLGANTGITYGSEKTLTIYEKLWNNTKLNRMINDCCEGGKHLNHSFISAINNAGISTSDFLNTPCAKQFGCYIVSGYKVYCPKDIPGRSCNSRNYSQLRACIQSQVVDRVGKPAFTETDYTYKCTYSVENEIVCPPDERGCGYIGLSAVYRTVDLKDPFPGREPAGNWDEELEYTYILNNRDVESNQVYSQRGPMYAITLTPSLANSIKNYNKKHDMSDYNLECNTAGEECKSNFIRDTYEDYFSGCGISGKGKKCVYGEAW